MQRTSDQIIDDLMAQLGYPVTCAANNSFEAKAIKSWITMHVSNCREYQLIAPAPSNMLCFLAPRSSGKTTAIKDLILNLKGTHVYVSKFRATVPGWNPSSNFWIKDLEEIRGLRADFIWVDEWCSYVSSRDQIQNFFILAPAAQIITLIGTPHK